MVSVSIRTWKLREGVKQGLVERVELGQKRVGEGDCVRIQWSLTNPC